MALIVTVAKKIRKRRYNHGIVDDSTLDALAGRDNMLMAVAPSSSSGGSHSATGFLIVGIAFIVIGGVQVLKPDLNYRMTRWQYRNKQALEPSNAALIVARVAGGIAVVVGIVLIVVAARK